MRGQQGYPLTMSGPAVVPLPSPKRPDDEASSTIRPVGFAPMGATMPEGLADVLARTGEIARRARQAEADRLARVSAIAEHAHAQIESFAAAVRGSGTVGPVAVRVAGRGRRAAAVPTWPVLYWRIEGFPHVSRSLHLFVDAEGRTYESAYEPGPFAVRGQAPPAEPVDVPALISQMAEVDARRYVGWLVAGLAEHLRATGAALGSPAPRGR